MIKQGTQEWEDLLQKFQYSTAKSNRDVLCSQCWKILKYEEFVKHKIFLPHHTGSILTSKKFASEKKFIEISKNLGKYFIDPLDCSEIFFSPYGVPDKKGRPSRNKIPYEELLQKRMHPSENNLDSFGPKLEQSYLSERSQANQKFETQTIAEVQSFLNSRYQAIIQEQQEQINQLSSLIQSLNQKMSNMAQLPENQMDGFFDQPSYQNYSNNLQMIENVMENQKKLNISNKLNNEKFSQDHDGMMEQQQTSSLNANNQFQAIHSIMEYYKLKATNIVLHHLSKRALVDNKNNQNYQNYLIEYVDSKNLTKFNIELALIFGMVN
eukprot:403363475